MPYILYTIHTYVIHSTYYILYIYYVPYILYTVHILLHFTPKSYAPELQALIQLYCETVLYCDCTVL